MIIHIIFSYAIFFPWRREKEIFAFSTQKKESRKKQCQGKINEKIGGKKKAQQKEITKVN